MFFLKQKQKKNCQKFGFHDNVIFCRCRNLEEAMLFLETFDLKFFEVGNEGLSDEGCKDSSQNIQEVERN